MSIKSLLFLSISIVVLTLGCNGNTASSLQLKLTNNPIEPPALPTTTIIQESENPTWTVEAKFKSFIEWEDEDCILRFPGELGELTTISRTYVENEPKKNIERIFQLFYQSKDDSTILRCDLRTAGLFATWWIQSFATKKEAVNLYETMIEITTPEIVTLNANGLSCSSIRAREDQQDSNYKSYVLDFIDKGLCNPVLFEGMSGIAIYGNTVIGVDSQFHAEFFDVIREHARTVVDIRS